MYKKHACFIGGTVGDGLFTKRMVERSIKLIEINEDIRAVLKTVDDPELIDVSVYDLGMVGGAIVEKGNVLVTMIPTFAGCPALHIIERDVKHAVESIEWVKKCEVEFSYKTLWTTESITEHGKKQLKKLGIAPPPENFEEGKEWTVNCPYCDSEYTSMENVFGPTACRSILYCMDCRNPFEAMKPVLKQEIPSFTKKPTLN